MGVYDRLKPRSVLDVTRLRAQSSLEYLLLIAGVIAAVVIVVVMFQGLIGTGGQQTAGGIGSLFGILSQLKTSAGCVNSTLAIDPSGNNATLAFCQAVDPNNTIVNLYSSPIVFNGSIDQPSRMLFQAGNTRVVLFILAKTGSPLDVGVSHYADVFVSGFALQRNILGVVASAGATPTPTPTATPTPTPSPLVVTIDQPVSGTTYGAAGVPLQVTLNTAGSSCIADPDSGPNVTLTGGPTVWSGSNITILSYGSHSMTYYCQSVQGVNASANVSFLVDLPPTVSLSSPSDGGAVTNGSVSFQYLPTEDSGYSICTLYGNFSGAFAANATNSTNVVNNTNNTIAVSLSAGSYSWNVRACDNAPVPLCSFAPANYTLNVLACATQPSGMVSWWAGEGNANDTLGLGNGTLVNGVTFTAGKVGQAFKFNGVNQYVDAIGGLSTYSFIQNTGNFTIEAWIKLNDSTSVVQTGILGNTATSAEKGFFLAWENQAGLRRLRFGLINGDGLNTFWETSTPNNVITDSNWHHVAVTGNGTALIIYVDGVAYVGGGPTRAFSTGGATRAFNIGWWDYPPLPSYGLFNGSIDEVQIYSRTLNATDIQAVYNAGAAGVCAVALQCTLPPGGIVAWWPGDGDATDLMGSYSGTLVNGATFATGEVGPAFSLNGVNQYVTVPDSAALKGMSQITIQTWFKASVDSSTYHYILTKQNSAVNNLGGYELMLSTGNVRAIFDIGGVARDIYSTGIDYRDNQWHHLAATYDGTMMRLYVDGVERANVSATGSIGTSTIPLTIGVRNDLAMPFSGLIDELTIANRSYNTNEVQSIYTSGSRGICKTLQCKLAPGGLVAWWQGDGNGSDAAGALPFTILGGTTYVTGEVGSAFNLDGVSGYAETRPTTIADSNQAGTLDYWIKTTGNGVVFSYSSVDNLANGNIDWEIVAGKPNMNYQATASGCWDTQTIEKVVNDGNWHHVAFTADGTTAVKGYVDGVAQSVTFSTSVCGAGANTDWIADVYGIGSVNNHFDLGAIRRGAAPEGLFSESLDEVEYYSRALSATEIQAIYNAGAGGKCKAGACVSVPSGLVSWWPGENGANDIQDGNNGVLQGNIAFSNGRVGRAFTLDGSGDAALLGNPSNMQVQDFTIDAWIKRSSVSQASLDAGGGGILLYGQYGWGFAIFDNGVLFLTKIGVSSTQTSSLAVTDTNWHHVAVTKSGSTVTFYKDGVSELAGAYDPGFTFTSNAAIGARGDTFGNSFLGSIDEVEFFNRSLTAAEIQSRYAAGSVGTCKTACASVPSGMVGWWPGDGDASDIVGSNLGTLQNGATFATGKVGSAFSLNGVNQYVSVPDAANLNITGNITLEAWVYPTSPLQTGVIVSKRSGASENYQFSVINDGTIQLCAPTCDYSASVVTANEWQHLAVTFDQNNKQFYRNGVLVQTTPRLEAMTPVAAPLLIGETVGTAYFKGYIDEVQIFNRTLGSTEVSAAYNASYAGTCKQSCTPVPSHATNWWPGDGNTNDLLGGLTAAWTNGPSYVAGRVGQGFSLNGVNQDVEVASSANLYPRTGSYSMGAWVKTGAINQIISSVYECGGYCPGGVANSLFQLYVGNGVTNFDIRDTAGVDNLATGTRLVNDSQWHFVYGVRDVSAGRMLIYVDGAVDANRTSTTGDVKDDDGEADPLTIGASVAAGSATRNYFFNGIIDELQIFKRALTPAEMLAMYNAGFAGQCKP